MKSCKLKSSALSNSSNGELIHLNSEEKKEAPFLTQERSMNRDSGNLEKLIQIQ